MRARIVKPVSAKQRANIERLKCGPRARVLAPVSEAGTSWWLGLSREQLREQTAAEIPRMSTSRFGRILGHGNYAE